MPWGRAECQALGCGSLEEFKETLWLHRPSVGHSNLWPCHHANSMDGDFPFNSQVPTAGEKAALLCSSPLGSGEKGEGGCPELLLHPAPVFISSSPSGLVWPDSPHNPSTGNVAAATDVCHEGAGNDSAKASSRWEDARVIFQKLSSYLFCHFCFRPPTIPLDTTSRPPSVSPGVSHGFLVAFFLEDMLPSYFLGISRHRRGSW